MALPGGGLTPAFNVTAVYAHRLLYVFSPLGALVALEPHPGTVRWERQIAINRNGHYGDFASRAVSAWKGRFLLRRLTPSWSPWMRWPECPAPGSSRRI